MFDSNRIALYHMPASHPAYTGVALQDSPLHILNCPSDVLKIIGRYLPRQDAIKFTSVCTQLFNLRFADTGVGILKAQYWERAPGSHEAISSRILIPNGREIVVRSMVRNDAPGVTALKLNFQRLGRPITTQELQAIILRLPTLVKLKNLTIESFYFPQKNIQQLFTIISQFKHLKTLTLCASLVPAEIGQFIYLQRLTITPGISYNNFPRQIGQLTSLQRLCITVSDAGLPIEIGQLHGLQKLKLTISGRASLLQIAVIQPLNLQRLTLVIDNALSLPTDINQLVHLQRLKIIGHRLTVLPAIIGPITLKSLDIRTPKLSCVAVEIGPFPFLQSLRIVGEFNTLSSEISQLSCLEEVSISSPYLIGLPDEMSQLSQLRKLTIIGNYLAPELRTAIAQLKLQGIKVEIVKP